MNPLRIIILIVLFYILYRLLFQGKRKLRGHAKGSQSGPSNVPPQDILVEDPVCHTLVPKRNAVTLNQGDETLYFCSKKCYEAYLSNKGADT